MELNKLINEGYNFFARYTMSGEGVKLANVSGQVDSKLADLQASTSYKIFKSKNRRQETEQDISAVQSYSGILSKVINFWGFKKKIETNPRNQKVATTSIGIKSHSSRPASRTNVSLPLRSNSQFSNTASSKSSFSTNRGTLNRCKECTCVIKDNSCTYCKNQEQNIQVLSDSDSDEFPSIEHLQQPSSTRLTKMSNNVQIPTTSFYSKENTSILNKSNISFTDDFDNEEHVKYDIDYLYIGTNRFLSRTYIRIMSDMLTLYINGMKNGINIDYKLVRTVFICEAKSDNSRYTYLKIDFCVEAINAINSFIDQMKIENGRFKADSINGHEKYFLMKLKYLDEDDAKKLKKRLKMYLQNNLKEDPTIYKMFEEQRHYCLDLKSRKKQKTSDSRTRSQSEKLTISEIKTDIRSNCRDEPMEIDRFPPVNCNNLRTRSAQYDRPLTRPITNTYERSPFQKRTFAIGSSNSIKLVEQDEMEVSEIKPKTSLPLKNIKNNKILYQTCTGEMMVILKTDISCLNEGNFLNDKIIEFYLMYIKSKLIDAKIAEKTYIFSSFFFTKILSLTKGSLSDEQFNENLYNLVKNWTKNIDIFDYDYLIVPIFRNYHWSLSIITHPGRVLKDDFEVILDSDDNEKPSILFMDSMGNKRIFYKFSKYLRNFLQKECQNKKGETVEFDNEQMTTINPEVPVQLNGYDCGIFVLHYVELFLKNPTTVIKNLRTNKSFLANWFESNELRGKRKEIYEILFSIYEDNLKHNLKFESEEDLTMKSDEEIEILTNDDDNKDLLSDDEDTML